MPDFPRRYHVLRDSSARASFLVEGDDRTVAYVYKKAIAEEVVKFAIERLSAFPGAAELSLRDAEACRDIWAALTPQLVDRPVALAEKSDAGLAFKRLAFDADITSPCPPTMREFLSRCSQPDALAAFLGSLFYPDADRQQYLYLYGDGQDGKGALLRMLFSLLGDEGSVSLAPKEKNDRFYNMRLFGKRLVMFPDCDDFEAFRTPHFKSMTGGDAIYFEPKGEAGFSAIPTCKVIAASNSKPHISNQRSDLRRLIFCEVSPFAGDLEAKYEMRLLAEAKALVGYCKGTYLKLSKNHGPISCDGEIVSALAEEAEEHYAHVFHKNFAVAGPEDWVRGDRVLEELRREGVKRGVEVARIKAAWRRTFGVDVKKGADGLMRYYGMKYDPGKVF